MTTFAVCSVLLLVIMSSRFVKYLAEAAAGKFDAEVLLAFMGFRLPSFIELILPLAFFLSIILSYGRLYLESEMVVLSSCGLSRRRLLSYTMITGVVIATIVGWLSLSVSPVGVQKFEALELIQKQRGELESMPARHFHSLSQGNVAYSETVEAGILGDVFFTESKPFDDSFSAADKNELIVIVAKSGYQQRSKNQRDNFLILEDGFRIGGAPGKANFSITKFDEFGQRLAKTKHWRGKDMEGEAIPTEQLWGSDEPAHKAALHWRLSMPVLVLIVTILAVPLSKASPRQGRYFKLLPSVLLYLIYLLSLKSGQDKVIEGEVSVFVGIWGVHLAFLLFGLVMFNWSVLSKVFTNQKRKSKAEGVVQ